MPDVRWPLKIILNLWRNEMGNLVEPHGIALCRYLSSLDKLDTLHLSDLFALNSWSMIWLEKSKRLMYISSCMSLILETRDCYLSRFIFTVLLQSPSKYCDLEGWQLSANNSTVRPHISNAVSKLRVFHKKRSISAIWTSLYMFHVWFPSKLPITQQPMAFPWYESHDHFCLRSWQNWTLLGHNIMFCTFAYAKGIHWEPIQQRGIRARMIFRP